MIPATKNLFVYEDGARVAVASLAPTIVECRKGSFRVDPELMRPEDRARCPYIGFAIGKGVTDPRTATTVFAVMPKLIRGLHAELVSDFPNIDPMPLCYDTTNHVHGFGGFVRWAYFADPRGVDDVLGIDWSLIARPTAGIATSFLAAMRVVQTLAQQGIAPWARVRLLNWRMMEDVPVTNVREKLQLETVDDWCRLAPMLFSPGSGVCPRCGLGTLARQPEFCGQCGCNPRLIYASTKNSEE